jgi:hypothetical protein
MVTSGKAWRERNQQIQTEGCEVTLLSGNVARVRNVPMTRLLTEIRNHSELDRLSPILAEQLGTSKPASQMKPEQVVQSAVDYYAFVDTIIRLAFVSPRIVDNPVNDDEIHISDIDQEDKNELVALLDMPARSLEPFCQELTRRVELVANEQNIPEIAESGDVSVPDEPGHHGANGKRRVDSVAVQ